jgi:predicted molibdopterin-dependent oxidoreductase YjgC
VLTALARELGASNLDLASPAEVFTLMARTERAFAGLEWEPLGGLQRDESLRERQHVG